MKSESEILDMLTAWPESWAIAESDVWKGEEIVAELRRFTVSLAEACLAPSTIRRHVNNLWLLGGEIIREINIYPEDRLKSAFELLAKSVDEEGGPISGHLLNDADQRSFDSTCKKLHKFLESQRRSI